MPFSANTARCLVFLAPTLPDSWGRTGGTRLAAIALIASNRIVNSVVDARWPSCRCCWLVRISRPAFVYNQSTTTTSDCLHQALDINYTVRHKKLHPCRFAINLSQVDVYYVIFCKQLPDWISNKTVLKCHLCWPSFFYRSHDWLNIVKEKL